MIASSTLNFVRQKAEEGTDWIKLHEQLKMLAAQAQKIKKETNLLSSMVEQRVKAESELKELQARVAVTKDEDRRIMDLSNGRVKAADEHVASAQRQADQMMADARSGAHEQITEANNAVVLKRAELRSQTDMIEHAKATLASLQQEHAELDKQHQRLLRKHQALQAGLAALTPNL